MHLRQRYPQLRLIAVSGNELPPAMRVSVDGHLLKGGQPEEIVSVLKAILDGSNRGREDDQEDPLVEGTILCVEDEDLQLQARRSLLESAGFQVFGARTSKAAMEIFQANHVDAVLMLSLIHISATVAAGLHVFAAIAESVADVSAPTAASWLRQPSVAPAAGVPGPASAGVAAVPFPVALRASAAVSDTSGQP